MKTVYYLSPSSFCFGVKRSIDQLNDIIHQHPREKIFCIHALVHNPKVTKEFEEKGIVFVEHLEEVKDTDAIIIFSAHGTNRKIIEEAKSTFKAVYNLECPFVTKIYTEVDTFIQKGIRKFVYIGKEHHQEGGNVVTDIRNK
jgi:4-hydroxy-3-methylbut-2-enyl diphosphate reductase